MLGQQTKTKQNKKLRNTCSQNMLPQLENKQRIHQQRKQQHLELNKNKPTKIKIQLIPTDIVDTPPPPPPPPPSPYKHYLCKMHPLACWRPPPPPPSPYKHYLCVKCALSVPLNDEDGLLLSTFLVEMTQLAECCA